MHPEEVKKRVEGRLEGCEAIVQAEGNHYAVTVIGAVFAGLTPVKKQQLVYGTISDCIADGSMHAVQIKTFTPEQWQKQQSC